jgi:peptide/nickel transport system substrate-binding protein
MPLTTRVDDGRLAIVQPHLRLGDPHVCSDDRSRLSLLHALYEPLVRRGAAGRFDPALAEAWDVDAEARRWSFTLRPGVRCHDGGPLHAHDAVASLARVRDDPPEGELGTSGVYAGYLRGCELRAQGDLRFEITTPVPMADLLDVLVELFVVPARHLARAASTPCGSGPFRLVEAGDAEIVMESHAAAWDGDPWLQQVRWLAEPDGDARVRRLREGGADLASDVPVGTDAVTTTWRPSSVATTFMFDLTGGPTADRRVRRALNHAVDVTALIDELFAGRAERTTSPCTSTQLGFDPALAPYTFDPAMARRLLADAGAAALELTFDVPSRLPDEAPRLARLLTRQLADVGVALHVVEHTDRPGYATSVRTKRIHDAACFDSSPHSTFRLFMEKFHAGARGPWWLGYDDPAFDAIVDDAVRRPQAAARATAYRQAARMLRDDAPWLFLYGPHLGWGLGDRAAPWVPTADGLVTLTPTKNGARRGL